MLERRTAARAGGILVLGGAALALIGRLTWGTPYFQPSLAVALAMLLVAVQLRRHLGR